MNDNDRSIVGFAMLAHATVHTYELSIPIFVVVWLQQFSTTTALLGTIVAVGYALFGIGALPGGVLADLLSARTVVIGCLLGMGGSFLLLGFAPGIPTIALALGLWGVAASVYHPAGLSLLSTGVSERGTGFAYHGMAGNVGIAFGPLATALLLLAFDWRTVAGLLSIPAALAVAYAVTAEFDEMAAVRADGGADEGRGGGPSSLGEFVTGTRTLFTAGFALAICVVLMNGVFYRGVLTFLPDVLGGFLPPITDYVRLFDPGSPMAEEFDLASYVYAGLLTVGIAGQYAGGKLTDRISVTTGLIGVFAALAVVAVLFVPAAQAGLGPLLAVSAVLGFVLFAIQPLYQATIAEYSPPDDRGLSYGFTYLANFGVGAAGAALSGILLSAVGTDGTFLALAAFPVLGAALAVALSRVGTRRGAA
ncbi:MULTISPECIES: MFS transporter [Halomicrobium]|uniref:Major facilitator superfamily MFS_1 n=2 Tax=Halomicrobium mukohataei TaxID=57705 RepID=C7NX62_HALMD|nr:MULTISPECIES: MFS transporter [Halomicrobium]ACV46427.1 major facilitator superfamily MFS_1 [Halomicrobium mukohataei DSM 12286]QCD64978.1 MFS transporter [Halomicrobium mukohataei]QFR19784.1 MFS transporter [Halomicrobium sp. ZPS1]